LVRILGVFKLMPTKEYFILMENIIPYSSEAFIFDLKGSSIGRYVDTGNPKCPIPGKILKDENFRHFDRKVMISETQYTDIIQVLEADMKLLMELNIMDYSILLGFYEKNHSKSKVAQRYLMEFDGCMYVVGIIDIFQQYNRAKISERAMKKVLFGDSSRFSVQPAGEYFFRLLDHLPMLFAISNDIVN
jgi:hypothetical protein